MEVSLEKSELQMSLNYYYYSSILPLWEWIYTIFIELL